MSRPSWAWRDVFRVCSLAFLPACSPPLPPPLVKGVGERHWADAGHRFGAVPGVGEVHRYEANPWGNVEYRLPFQPSVVANLKSIVVVGQTGYRPSFVGVRLSSSP